MASGNSDYAPSPEKVTITFELLDDQKEEEITINLFRNFNLSKMNQPKNK